VLLRHIRHEPIIGQGFGAIAADYPYSNSYSYELSYLDLLFKTGVAGLLLFLSFPLRLGFDAVRGRYGRVSLPPGVRPEAMSIVLATIAVILVDTATNPVIATSFGLLPIVLMIAWLDPVHRPHVREPDDSHSP
jgi:O-antigen ligase